MKKFIENFRIFESKTTLEEAANTFEDLPEDVVVVYKITDASLALSFFDKEWDAPLGKEKHLEEYDDSYPYGNLWAETRASANEPCSGAYIMNWVEAKHGWGPFLYDIAMELATEAGTGLAADRSSVSRDAEKIWRYYYYKRNDVESIQLDDQYGELTPDDHTDDCDQRAAVKWARGTKQEWYDQPVSKMYRKPDLSVITKLRSMNKLVQEE